jgi:hypothetical protein
MRNPGEGDRPLSKQKKGNLRAARFRALHDVPAHRKGFSGSEAGVPRGTGIEGGVVERGGQTVKTFHFHVTLVGSGRSVEEAWEDARERFLRDDGGVPEDDEYDIVDDEDGGNVHGIPPPPIPS